MATCPARFAIAMAARAAGVIAILSVTRVPEGITYDALPTGITVRTSWAEGRRGTTIANDPRHVGPDAQVSGNRIDGRFTRVVLTVENPAAALLPIVRTGSA